MDFSVLRFAYISFVTIHSCHSPVLGGLRLHNAIESDWSSAKYHVNVFRPDNIISNGVLIKTEIDRDDGTKFALWSSVLTLKKTIPAEYMAPEGQLGLDWCETTDHSQQQLQASVFYADDTLLFLQPHPKFEYYFVSQVIFREFSYDNALLVSDTSPSLYEPLLVTGSTFEKDVPGFGSFQSVLLYRTRPIPGLAQNTFLATGNKDLDEKFQNAFAMSLTSNSDLSKNWFDTLYTGFASLIGSFLNGDLKHAAGQRNACLADIGSPVVCQRGGVKVLCGLVNDYLKDTSEPDDCSKGYTVILDISKYKSKLVGLTERFVFDRVVVESYLRDLIY